MPNTEEFVCLDLPEDSEQELGKLSPAEGKMALWNAENEAIKAAKEFAFCSNPIGESGTWLTPTVQHDVIWYWRYSGIRSDRQDRPGFSISHIVCESKSGQATYS